MIFIGIIIGIILSSFLNMQIYCFQFKIDVDCYYQCKHEIGIIYPYILYSLCEEENKYVFEKIQAYTNNSQWKMQKLFNNILIQPQQNGQKQEIQLTIISQTYFVITNWTQSTQKSKEIRMYQINPNIFLFYYPPRIQNNTIQVLFSKLFFLQQPQLKQLDKNVKWVSAFNGSTNRFGFLSHANITVYQEQIQIINITVFDIGFNDNNQNPIFQIHLQLQHIGINKIDIFEIGGTKDGKFLLFIGSLKRLKVFQLSLQSMLAIQTIKLQNIDHFSIINRSYIYTKQNHLYLNSFDKEICFLNKTDQSKIQIMHNKYVKLCQQLQKCLIINQECEVIDEIYLINYKNKIDILRNNKQYNNVTYDNQTLQFLKQIQQKVFFQQNVYFDKLQFAYLYADQLMQGKLSIFPQYNLQSPQQQSNNCALKIQNYHNKSYISGIQFNNSNKHWKVCRVGFQTKANYAIHQPQKQQITKPYFFVACLLLNKSFPYKKCYYIQDYLKLKRSLSSNLIYRFYIFNRGQTYNITIKDMNRQELQRVKDGFLYILLFIFLVAIILLLKCCIGYMCLYYGWTRDQPRYYYPLNTIHLKIKLKRLKKKGYFKYKKFKVGKATNQIICCFCLQQIQNNQKVIQLYCKHEFHASCYENWVRSQQGCKCPVCKRGFTENELNDFLNSRLNFKEPEQAFQISDVY